MKRLKNAVLHLGSNEGNRWRFLQHAIELIERRLGVIHENSAVYETEAWGNTMQNNFLNQVVMINTSLNPYLLLDEINLIEEELGRIRTEKWGSRVIDIDILFFDNEIIKSEKLQIPHALVEKRKFVLVPLCEILPDYFHPISNKKIRELLDECEDKSDVFIWEKNSA